MAFLRSSRRLRCPRRAQTVTSADIQRLQDQVYQASGDVSRLRSSNPDAASRLQGDLDDLRDDVVYLKVKLRKEGSINRTEYTDVQNRLQDLRSKATADNRSDTQGWSTNSNRDRRRHVERERGRDGWRQRRTNRRCSFDRQHADRND